MDMIGFEPIGKMLLLFGGLMVVLGLVFLLAGNVPFLGKLPGDILFQKGNFTFFFPLVTMIIVSVVLTLLLNVVLRLLT